MTPRTAAGRALLRRFRVGWPHLDENEIQAEERNYILAIEAEAEMMGWNRRTEDFVDEVEHCSLDHLERLARALKEAGYGVGQPVDVARLATAYARLASADREGTA